MANAVRIEKKIEEDEPMANVKPQTVIRPEKKTEKDKPMADIKKRLIEERQWRK